MSAQLDHARRLLRKAHGDLLSAEDILAAGRVRETVCFHCQQAVEKSLKALLAAADVAYPRTHDLRLILELVHPLHGDVPPSALEIVALSQYAVELRYEELLHPGLAEAAHALEVARQVFAFAERIVASVAEHPPKKDKKR